MNDLLDEVARIRAVQGRCHDWKSESDKNKKKGPSKAEQRVAWVRKLIVKFKLSPLEHRWVVRILLQRLDLGMGYKTILKYYSPYAEELYSANNSLKSLCTTLSDPRWVTRRKTREEEEKQALLEDKL